MRLFTKILRAMFRPSFLLMGLLALPFSVLSLVVWGVLLAGVNQWRVPMPYLFALAGCFGWVALFRLASLINKPLSALPGWVLLGVLSGVLSAAVVGFSLGDVGAIAMFPIILAVALLGNNLARMLNMQRSDSHAKCGNPLVRP